MKEGEKEYTKVKKNLMNEGVRERIYESGKKKCRYEGGRERIHESKKKINIRISMNNCAFGSRIL